MVTGGPRRSGDGEPGDLRVRRHPIWRPVFIHAFVAHLFLSISFQAMVLFPLFVQRVGGDAVTIGLLTSAALCSGILLRWVTTPLWHRIPRRLLFAVGGLLNVSGLLLLLAVSRLGWLIYGARLLQGGGIGLLFGVFFAYAGDLLPADRRSEGLGIFGVSGMAGGYLGTRMGETLLGHGGYSALFLGAGIAAALSLVISLGLPERGMEPSLQPQEGTGPKKPPPAPDAGMRCSAWAHIRLWALCSLFGGAIATAFVFLAPYAEARGLRPISPFFLTYAAMAVTLRLLAGSLPDRVGYRRTLGPALACFSAGLVVLAFARGLPWLLGAGLLCGAGHGYAFPILGAIAVARAGPGRRRLYLGLFTSFIDFGVLLGGPLLGFIARGAGYPPLFWGAGLALAIGSAVILVIDRRSVPCPAVAPRASRCGG